MPGDLAVYIHWPFCRSKCPYCDFNSHVRTSVDDVRWRAALLAGVDRYARLTPGRRVTSIFFGGGTPSLMPPATAAAVIERIAERWPLDDRVEITLEANPTLLEADRLADFRAAGVNRLSLGVQSLDDDALRFLGRGHSAEDARRAIALAARLFDRFSFDLIYALPGQPLADWSRQLEAALALASGHISAYQLTIEPGTAFHGRHRRGELALPPEAAVEGMYEETQARLEAAGLPAYEISNHAAPGQECRHNMIYWRYGDYVGIGPGAHGRLTLVTEGEAAIHATRQHRLPEAWLAAAERGADTDGEMHMLDPDEIRDELVMMGLRLRAGIARSDFSARLGIGIEEALSGKRLAQLVSAGLLRCDETGLRATASGRRRLDSVLAYLLADST